MSKLLLKTWRDVGARKAQFIALIVLVGLGITSYVAFISGYRDLQVSATHAYEKLLFADFSVSVFGAPKSVVKKIQAVPGVEAVQGRLIIDTGIVKDDGSQATVRIIGIPAPRHPQVDDVLVVEGSYIDKQSTGMVLLHKKYASDEGKKPGDTLTIRTDGTKRKVRIAGIAVSPEYLFALRSKGDIPMPGQFAVVFMDQREVERLFGRAPTYNDIAVLLKKGADRAKVMAEVDDILDPYHVVTTVKEEDQASNFSLQEEIKQNQTVAYFMPLLILVVSSLSLFIALSRLVQSQRGEIGLAKALGYADWQILLHYLLFSLVVAVGGLTLGTVIGDLSARGLARLYVDMMGIPFLKHQLQMPTLIGAASLSTVSCVLAGLVPAFISARIAPAKAMHADPNVAVSGGRTPLVERLLAALHLLPSSFTVRIPLRNVFRVRRRSIYTIIGIAFALILTVTTWSEFDSIDYLMDHEFNFVEKQDVLAVFSRNFSEARVREVAGWRGVKKVQAALQLPATLEANGKDHEGVVTATAPGATFHGFDIIRGDEAETALEKGGLIMTPAIADKLRLKVGDELTVKTPYIDEPVTVELLALSNEMVGAPVYTSLEESKELTDSRSISYNTLYLNVVERETDRIKAELYDLPGAVAVVVKASLIIMLNEMMKLTIYFGAILFAFAFTMAFIVVYNTFTANVIERTREIATMMTIGEDRTHLAIIITLENLFLALVGVPFGLYLGKLSADSLYASMSTEAFHLEAVIYPQSYVWIVLSILAVLLVSQIPAIRRVFRLDLAAATKVME